MTTTYPTVTICRHCRTEIELSPRTQTATIFTGTHWFHTPTGLRTCGTERHPDMLAAVLADVPMADPLVTHG